MTTMLEKAARAAAECRGDWPWDRLREGIREHNRDTARAVLMAVRVPDEAAQNVGVDTAAGLFEGWVDEGQVSTLFTAMIDHILKGGA